MESNKKDELFELKGKIYEVLNEFRRTIKENK